MGTYYLGTTKNKIQISITLFYFKNILFYLRFFYLLKQHIFLEKWVLEFKLKKNIAKIEFFLGNNHHAFQYIIHK